MDYQGFKERLYGEMQRQYGELAEISEHWGEKGNGCGYDGIIVRKKTAGKGMTASAEQSVSVAPVVPVEPFYEAYKTGRMGVTECSEAVWQLVGEAEENLPDVGKLCSWEEVRGQVYPMLISAEKDKGILSTLVTDRFLDLSVIYIIRMDGGIIRLTEEMLERYGADREGLKRYAMENLKKDGYRFSDLVEKLAPFSTEIRAQKAELDDKAQLYVLTNTSGMFGAAGLLNLEMVQEFASGKDFYILPSSIHEVLFWEADGSMGSEALSGMVREVNEQSVMKEEQLSEHCYFYDGKSGVIRICA